jgi:hypothetical protein
MRKTMRRGRKKFQKYTGNLIKEMKYVFRVFREVVECLVDLLENSPKRTEVFISA